MSRTPIDPQQLHQLYESHVGPDLQRALVAGVVEGYRTTWESAKDLQEEVQVQGWRYTRWNGVDSAILAVGKRFKSAGVKAAYVANTCETDVKHTELTIGPIVITVASVQDRNELPRSAAYRDNLAESNQLLFGDERIRPDRLWVPLLHIPNPELKLPAAIYAAFPDGTDQFAAEHLDLLARYPIDGAQGEKIADEAAPVRRTQTEKGS